LEDAMPSFPIVDSHVHLYDPTLLDYPWMADHPDLLHPHLLADLDRAAGRERIDSAVFVEVDVAANLRLREAEWVADMAAAEPRIGAMVASADLERGSAVRDDLDVLSQHPALRGIRRLIQSEPDPDFCLRPLFIEGVRLLAEYGLSFDICIRHHQMPSATELVRQCPNVQFVLDHLGKPPIKDQILEPWRSNLRSLAALPNVTCKISGVITEADPANWNRDQLRPYIEHAITCFGFDRVMYGGDWPVINLGGTYEQWIEILDWVFAGCSSDEKSAFYRDTATRTYRL
jgi:L-fuconolactonase